MTGGVKPTLPARHLPAIATYAGVWAVCCAWRWQAGRERSGEAGGRRGGPPCLPWRDRKRGTAVFQHPGLGQGRDRSWTMPRREKPGLGQGFIPPGWHWRAGRP
ncbi:MAG: hypothetical protein JRF30_02740 [Deltaproteobacteria bacterium]|nr:hypothetical protein [Deltaproteobacteria bacterium]MBW1793357.1 hypothetical protein [Deltaproteobacteria bacterium]MBW2329852.1 hypothetical protein [Deltaproteobacteria bacterium]